MYFMLLCSGEEIEPQIPNCNASSSSYMHRMEKLTPAIATGVSSLTLSMLSLVLQLLGAQQVRTSDLGRVSRRWNIASSLAMSSLAASIPHEPRLALVSLKQQCASRQPVPAGHLQQQPDSRNGVHSQGAHSMTRAQTSRQSQSQRQRRLRGAGDASQSSSDTGDVEPPSCSNSISLPGSGAEVHRTWGGLQAKFPWGCFLSQGSFKKVYCVCARVPVVCAAPAGCAGGAGYTPNGGVSSAAAVPPRAHLQAKHRHSVGAMAVMDTSSLVDSGQSAVVVQELGVALLLSRLVTEGECPNFVVTHGVFHNTLPPPPGLWGCEEARSPLGGSPPQQLLVSGCTEPVGSCTAEDAVGMGDRTATQRLCQGGTCIVCNFLACTM